MRFRMLLLSFVNILFVLALAIMFAFVLLHIFLPPDKDRVLARTIWQSALYNHNDFVTDKLSPHISEIPAWWKYLPFMGANMATTIYPKIYLPSDMYIRFADNSTTVWDRSVLLHEEIHVVRQKAKGTMGHAQYLFLSETRLLEELIPIYLQMKYLKAHSENYDIARKANQFSSSAYLWVLTREDARALLSALWDEA